MLVTFTVSHDKGDSVAQVLDDVMTCWLGMTDSRVWRDLPGKQGFIRSTEVTHSWRHGAHPHHHVVTLLDRPLSVDEFDGGELEAFRLRLDEAWTYQAEKLGRSVHPVIGVTAVPIRDAAGIGAYVSKIGMEMARSDTKRGRSSESRTHWQVAVDVADPDRPLPERLRDRRLWRQFVQAMSRHRFMSYSRGLLAEYGVEEVLDDEAARERLEGRTDTARLAEVLAARPGLTVEVIAGKVGVRPATCVRRPTDRRDPVVAVTDLQGQSRL